MTSLKNAPTEASEAPFTGRKLKVAIAGLGMGATQIIKAMEATPYLDLMGAAEVRPESLKSFEQRFGGGHAYQNFEDLCKDPEVEAIWISTPNNLHAEQAVMAAQYGKHVVIEKPMAVSLEEAEKMVNAHERAGTKLIAGHTASLMAGFQAMRRVITSGRIGQVRAINDWVFGDYIFRPRMPQELITELGGGVVYCLGPHSIDVVRLMGGGMVRSVRGMTGNWMPFRNGIGYYCAYLEFEDGTPAMITHDGYGYFYTYEFVPWAWSGKSTFQPEAGNLRKALRAGDAVNDAPGKEDMRFGGKDEGGMYNAKPGEVRRQTGYQPDAGIVIVSGDKGAVRQGPGGLIIYDDDGTHEVPVAGIADERIAELAELYDAVIENRPARHDGRWGMATLEVVLAIMQSARERREIFLTHQCPAWE